MAEKFPYDAVILDCDGVVLDSNGLKIESFRKTLEVHGFDADSVAAGSAWQVRAFGTSRYRLFEAMLSGRFGPPPPVPLDDLLFTYGSACAAGYLDVPETPRLRASLASLSAAAKLYVVSGSDEAELQMVFRERGLSRYFAEIFGSPATKVENIGRVREAFARRVGREPRKMLFVGDAVADADAARATECEFVFMSTYSTVRAIMLARADVEGFRVIGELGHLTDV